MLQERQAVERILERVDKGALQQQRLWRAVARGGGGGWAGGRTGSWDGVGRKGRHRREVCNLEKGYEGGCFVDK